MPPPSPGPEGKQGRVAQKWAGKGFSEGRHRGAVLKNRPGCPLHHPDGECAEGPGKEPRKGNGRLEGPGGADECVPAGRPPRQSPGRAPGGESVQGPTPGPAHLWGSAPPRATPASSGRPPEPGGTPRKEGRAHRRCRRAGKTEAIATVALRSGICPSCHLSPRMGSTSGVPVPP